MAGSRRNNKRKLEEPAETMELLINLTNQLNLDTESDITKALKKLCTLAKRENNVDLLWNAGVVPALVRQLRKGHKHAGLCVSLLGLIVRKTKHQDLIAKEGSLACIVDLLKSHQGKNSPEANEVLFQAASAITLLVSENNYNKTIVRAEGGIPILVKLLESTDEKVLQAAIRALCTLASENEEIKTQIGDSTALQTLVGFLWSDNSICNETVGLFITLARRSPHIQTQVCSAGALHPTILLLSSTSSKRRRGAAFLIGRLADDPDRMAQIVQRGALHPLVEMLVSQDEKSKESASYALGKLSQDQHTDNQAGIFNAGGIPPLVKLLDSSNITLKQNGVYALFGLALSEDIVTNLMLEGAVEKLLECGFDNDHDLANKTLGRLAERVAAALDRLLRLIPNLDKPSQCQMFLALAFLCSTDSQKRVFVDNNGIDSLLGLLQQTHSKHCKYAFAAFCSLAEKASSLSLVVAEQPSPIPKVCRSEQYVDSPALSDVTFLVEGKRFNASKTLLCEQSCIFEAMFNGGFKEKDAKEIEISNIGCEAFKEMMEYIKTGLVDLSIPKKVVYELLIAADQYFIHGLKRLCENAIIQDINGDNLQLVYRVSHYANAAPLRHSCCLFALKNFQELNSQAWYRALIGEMLPDIKDYFTKMLDET